MIDAVVNGSLKTANLLDELLVRQEVKEQIGVYARTSEETDWTIVALRGVARVLQGVPGALQQDATLWVHRLRIAWTEAEEIRVEEIGAFQHPFGFDVVWRVQLSLVHACLNQFLLGEERDRLHAAAKVAPELIDVRRAGKSPGHSDNSDAILHACSPTNTDPQITPILNGICVICGLFYLRRSAACRRLSARWWTFCRFGRWPFRLAKYWASEPTVGCLNSSTIERS